MAIGYWLGGRISQNEQRHIDILQLAGLMLALSAICHTIACIVQLPLMDWLQQTIRNNLISGMIVGLLFGVGISFGSACIPLITQYLTNTTGDQHSKGVGKFTGQMVATTTIGSVVGSTLTPIILIPNLGLMGTLAICISCLVVSAALCSLIIYSRKENGSIKNMKLTLMLAALSGVITLGFVKLNKINTGYQTAINGWFIKEVKHQGNDAIIITDAPNLTRSSCWVYATRSTCTWYGQAVSKMIVASQPSQLLFLGGAGMSIPSQIAYNYPNASITVVDLDKDLKPIVEQHFLKSKLAKNINFIGDDGRAFVIHHKSNKFDYLLVDAFHGEFVVSNLFTIQALKQFESISKHIVANVIGYPSSDHHYTQVILATWYRAFGENAYIVLQPTTFYGKTNMLLCNYACAGGRKLSTRAFFNKAEKINTDNLPALDKYTYSQL